MERDADATTTEAATTTPNHGPSAPELPPGRMLAGDRYRIGELIGRGGMGAVHAARDLQIGREVAIKRLRARTLSDHTLERFMREACIQGRLEHPAIVPVHELCVDGDGLPFFVMKKLAGTTLAKLVTEPPSEESRRRLLRAFVDVCLAVEFAHTRGFIHRDLKPDNIVLGEFGEVYVLDWGVAKVTGVPDHAIPGGDDDALTGDGIVVGTPGYMSPEQARGMRDVDPRADVYALGCILFEILAGERLHPSGPAGAASTLAGIDGRPSRRTPDRDIAPELDAICLLATATDRERRFASARKLSDHVQRYLDGDRDLAMRRQLARDHLAAALAAFAGGDTEAARRTTMRLAGRALALDPTLAGAAELVGRLMLEPPRALPAEVQFAASADAAVIARRAARTGMWAYLAYVAMLPVLLAAGFRDPVYPLALIALIATNIGLLWWQSRLRTPRPAVLPFIATAFMIAMLARMFSPFLVAPGIAAVCGMAFTFGLVPASWRSAAITIAVMAGAVLLPWLAEVTGIVSTTIEHTRTAIIMLSPALQDNDATSTVLLIGYTVLLVTAAVVLATQVQRAESRAREHLHLQAWQLRQLVPTST